MKAPDKVYYTQTEHAANYFTTGEPFERDCVEYIRKDALLDKLNLALKLRGDGNNNSNNDGTQTIKAMINYIESL